MKLRCGVCPHNCLIEQDRYGYCGVRKNTGGGIVDTGYGVLSGLAMDPIEKKPLYHFHPGEYILSAGFYGCSFRCPFCQNHSISQRDPAGRDFALNRRKPTAPEELAAAAGENGSFGIAYTYSEPLIHFEYVLETSRLAREAGLKNVLITNGYVNPGPAEELLPWIDAANVDLKSFSPEFYRKELKGDLETVKNFILRAHGRIHLEITTLVIPGKNDSPEEIRALCGFIAGLDRKIPLHLSAYHPAFHYTVPPTRRDALFRLVDIAREQLDFVYPGNV